MINLLYFRIEPQIKEQIENFSENSINQKINFQSTEILEEFKNLYDSNSFHLIFMNVSSEKDEIINIFKKIPVTFCKLIIFSPQKSDAFEFINFNVFGFITYPLDTVQILSAMNRFLNARAIENDARQFIHAKSKFQKFVSINSIKKIELIKTDDISHFEADGRYTIIYLTNGVSKMASKNLGEFQKLLNPDVFCRIHHKFIINMNNLLNIMKSDGYYCEMTNNKHVPVSKRKLENLNEILNLGKSNIVIK